MNTNAMYNTETLPIRSALRPPRARPPADLHAPFKLRALRSSSGQLHTYARSGGRGVCAPSASRCAICKPLYLMWFSTHRRWGAPPSKPRRLEWPFIQPRGVGFASEAGNCVNVASRQARTRVAAPSALKLCPPDSYERGKDCTFVKCSHLGTHIF